MITTDTALKGKAIASSKRNPCPICQKTHGCKISDNLVMCLRGDSNWSIPGWKYLKPLRGGMGGLFGADSGERQEYRPEQQPKAKPSNITPLTDEQLDREARKLLKQLGLTAKHREQLRGRGLTDEQIDLTGFKSADRNQEFNLISVSPNFPGMGTRGTLTNGGSGILIPAVNIKGLIIGLQIARDDREPKYQHLSGCSKRRVSGERPLPLTKINDSRKLDIAEGFLKSIKSAYLHNINVLGEGGCQWASSPKELMEIVNSNLFDSYVLNPDTGSLLNNNVMGGYRALYLFLKKLGINLLVRDWGQGNKPKSDKIDVDEISTETFNNASIIPYQEWDVEPSEVEKAITERRRLTKFSPNIPVINEKYIPIDVVRNILKPDVSIGIKSPTNSGKSFLINQLTKTDLKNHYVVYLTARESLSRNFAKNSGALLYKDKGFETLSRKKNAFVVVTIDSILKIPFEMIVENGWKLAIIGDESEEITRHIINAGTIKGRQGIILERLTEMVKYADVRLHLDGHLTDATVDYWDTIAGKKSIKIQNIFVNPRPPIKIFKDINTAKQFCKVIPLMQEILENEQRILFQSDSSKLTESYGIILDNGNNNSLIGTRDIKGGKNGKETAELISKFLDDPAQTINDYPEKKIIGMSPIIQSGVDISYSDKQQNRPDVGVYFSSHLGIDAFLQTLIRERRPELLRYLAIVDSVKMTEDDNILATTLSDIERIEKRKIIDIYKSYGDDINEQNAQILEIVRQALESPETKIRQHYKTIDNIDKLYHKDVLVACLNDDGYLDVEFITIDDELIIASGGEKELEGLVKGEKNKLDESHCVDVFDSPDLSEEAARELEKKPGDISYQSGCSLKKHKIKEKIPGCPITLDLLKDLIINKKDCLKKAEARALITYSQELTNRRTKYIDSIIKYNPKLLKNKDYTEDLKLLVKTDILKMVEELKGDRTITSDSEPIMKWIERFSTFSGRNCCQNGNETEEQFNARCKKWVMNTVNHHLAIIGFNLATIERKAKVRYRALRDDLILESSPNILDYVNARICELANIPYVPSWEMTQEPTTPFSECETLPPLTHLTYVENKPTPSSDKLPHIDINKLGDLSSSPVPSTPTTECFEPTPSSDNLPYIDIEKIAKLSSGDEAINVSEPTPEPITTPEPEPLTWKGVMGRIKNEIAPYWLEVYKIYKESNPLTRSGARVKSVDNSPTWKHNAMAPNGGGLVLLVQFEGLVGTKVNIPIDCLEFEG